MSQDYPANADADADAVESVSILVVDDEPNVLQALRRQLRKNYQVYTAESASEGLTILDEIPIDIVISDQRMPLMNGSEFLAEVQTKFPNTIRLMLTGYADIQAVIDAINQANIRYYLHKPWNPADLEQILSNIVEVRALRAQNDRMAHDLRRALKTESRFNSLRNRFVSIVSHEFRTPLTKIGTSATLIERKSETLSPQQLQTKAHKILEQVEHMRNLMDDVANITRYDQEEHIDFRPVPLDVSALLDQCVQAIHEQTGRVIHVNKVEVHSGYVGVGYLLIDLMNELLTNAIKFSPPDTSITCMLTVSPTEVNLTVCDEGIGIGDADVEDLFVPYFKAPNAEHFEGLGLGLALVSHAVNLHRGVISLTPNEGAGVTVRLQLPSLNDSQ
jgi:signal transduction histidine kinase